MIQIDLGESFEKAKTAFETGLEYSVGNAAADEALKLAQDTAEKTKAVIDGIIASVEDDISDIAVNGAQKLYESLGLNEENLNFARNIVKMATHGANLAGSAVLKGMDLINSMDMHGLPMSAVAAGLSASQTYADMLVGLLIERYGAYAEMAIQFIVDPDKAVEQMKEMIDIAVQQIDELIDSQLELYLGMTLPEVKRYCNFGIRLYKEYKEAKKRIREKENNDGESASERDTVIESTGHKTSVDIDVELNPEALYMEMMDWLTKTSDGIYNGFVTLQVLDAAKTVQEVIKTLTDVSLDSLADSINSLDDLVAMLDELGLGDDSTAVDLSLIPSLNINSIVSAFNSLKDNFDAVQTAASLAVSVSRSLDLSGSVNQTVTYNISTDTDTKTITIIFYNDTSNGAKNVYKTLKNAKDANKNNLFDVSELKVINEHISKLSKDNTQDSFRIGKYGFVLKLEINEDEEYSGNRDVLPVKRNDSGLNDVPENNTPELQQRESIRRKKADGETRRNTIMILHTAFSIIKTMLGTLKPLIILISNYKINKAYVQGAHSDNLAACFMDAVGYLGLGKKASADGKSVSSPRLYTVRTVSLYNYVNTLEIDMSDDVTTRILTTDEIVDINKWLSRNEPPAGKIPEDGYTKLYIDTEGIAAERRCLSELRSELIRAFGPGAENISYNADTCRKVDGTFDNIANIEVCGDIIAYSDSSLPRMPSQIMTAIRNGYK